MAIAILAPLAVVPDAQKQGIGGKLIQEGGERLARSRVLQITEAIAICKKTR